MNLLDKKRSGLLIAGIISLVTLAVYLPALRNGFVNWDDPHYVVLNSHIRTMNPEFFRWAFFDASTVYWHPLTWISHALDYAVWGLDPLGHHLTSIVLHALNTFIVVILTIRFFEISSGCGKEALDYRAVLIAGGVVGVLFGLHPVHVESVAWVAERKDLLYSLFYLLSVMSYVDFIRNSEASGTPDVWYRSRRYYFTLVLFFLSLCGKPMAVTLPAVLLLLDWYLFKRIAPGKGDASVLLEKVPFLVLSVIVSIVTVIAQKKVGAVASLDAAPFVARVLVASRAIMRYLWEIIVPVNLLPLYPYPKHVGILMPEYFVPLLLVAGITVACVLLVRKKKPVWLTLWGYFVVTLLPVLGLVQSGPQAMADRFLYLPSFGPFLLAGAGVAWLWPKAASIPTAKYITTFVAAVLALSLLQLTLKQIAVWHDSITLWSCTINGQPERFSEPYYLRGIAYGDAGDFVSAIRDYTTAVTVDSTYGPAYINRGVAFLERGEVDDAIDDFNRAITLKTNLPDSYTNRGNAYYKKKELDRAIADYSVAISLEPSLYQAYVNRGNIYKVQGQVERALGDYTKTLSMNPEFSKGYLIRGDLYLGNGSVELAIKDYQKACSLGSESGCSKALFPVQGVSVLPQK